MNKLRGHTLSFLSVLIWTIFILGTLVNSDAQVYFRVFALAILLIFIKTRQLNLFTRDSNWEVPMLAMFLSIVINMILLWIGF